MKCKRFLGLNYTLANEDTFFEYSLLKTGLRHVLSIAGSGSRVVPLLAKNPIRLTCIDLSQEQLYLTELRLESIRCLSRAEFLQFWGYPSEINPGLEPGGMVTESHEDRISRQLLFEQVNSLKPQTREYFLKFFERVNWSSILYVGSRERAGLLVSRFARVFVGKMGLKIFECRGLEEQILFWENNFPQARWKTFLLLYSGLMKVMSVLRPSNFPRKNYSFLFYPIYRASIDRMFRSTLGRENFLLQVFFFGKVVFQEGCPIECDSEIFSSAKEALKTVTLEYSVEDVIQWIKKSKTEIDFVSLSNAPSYFSEVVERSCLQEIFPKLSNHALVVIRNFLHCPDWIDARGYNQDVEGFREANQAEKTQSYDNRVYQKLHT